MAYKSQDVAVSDGIKKKKKGTKTGSTTLTKGAQLKSIGDSMFGGIGKQLGFGDKLAAKFEAKKKNG